MTSTALFRVAGQDVAFSPLIPELRPFRSHSKPLESIPLPANLEDLAARPATLKAQGWIADRLETLSLWWDDSGILFQIPAAGLYWTAADGSVVQKVSSPAGLNPSVLAQSLLGPPLVLALALSGVWCLHASAIRCGEGTAAFLGESGAGKSTLAGFIGAQAGAKLLADDILPVTAQAGKLWARPHFPQLKLGIDGQPGRGSPEQVPLTAVYMLEEGPSIKIEVLSPAQAVLTLASHSVAARLFDRHLLGAHFEFCVQAAQGLPVRRFCYPRKYAELPTAWRALQTDLAGLHA